MNPMIQSKDNPLGLNKMRGSAPLYMQIRDFLVEKISAGDWKPGAVIPSEMELARQMGVSQGTVRQSITELVENNVLMRRQGLGTFVAHHDSERDLFHFFHLVDADGRKVLPDSETLSTRRKAASKEEVAALNLKPGSTVFVIERVRKLDGLPTLLETIILPAKPFARLGKLAPEALPNTLYSAYEREFGVTIQSAKEQLTAVSASKADAEKLGVESGQPLLQIKRIAMALDGSPVELRVSRCLTACHHYENTIF